MTALTPEIAAIRFGFGLPAAPPGVGAMMDRLTGPDTGAAAFPGAGLAAIGADWQAAAAAREGVRAGTTSRADYRAAVRVVQAHAARAVQVDLARAVAAEDGLRERLVRFWADHFTTESRFLIDAALPAALVEDAIRPHVAGRFADMLQAATLHPAMLIYLDQVRSVGPNSAFGRRRGLGLNENLARELLELHSVGVGADYRQEDIRQAAEVLAGLRAEAGAAVRFDTTWAEPGAATVMGRVYTPDTMRSVKDLLTDLAGHPATARHIARKLAVHFVADDPPPDLVEAMAGAWGRRGNLRAVVRAMLGHPAAAAPPGAKVRQPFEFVAAALRALAVPPAAILSLGRGLARRRFILPLRAMGQEPFRPGGPDGWEETARAWINPQGLAARIAWAMEAPGDFVVLPDPRALVDRALGPMADERLVWAVSAAEQRAEGVGLVLASPAFNRR
jgi:uncharacterized protein (DUF1800 family)